MTNIYFLHKGIGVNLTSAAMALAEETKLLQWQQTHESNNKKGSMPTKGLWSMVCSKPGGVLKEQLIKLLNWRGNWRWLWREVSQKLIWAKFINDFDLFPPQTHSLQNNQQLIFHVDEVGTKDAIYCFHLSTFCHKFSCNKTHWYSSGWIPASLKAVNAGLTFLQSWHWKPIYTCRE